MIKKIIISVLASFFISDAVAQQALNCDTLKSELGYEVCIQKASHQFSFCNDGYEQFYRFPLMVKVDEKNFINSYDDITYNISDSCYFPNGTSCRDSIESLISITNTISFENKEFQRRVNKYRLKSQKVFDGKFYYALFNLEAIVDCSGTGEISLPKFNSKKKRQLIEDKMVKMYDIKRIISIRPCSLKR